MSEYLLTFQEHNRKVGSRMRIQADDFAQAVERGKREAMKRGVPTAIISPISVPSYRP